MPVLTRTAARHMAEELLEIIRNPGTIKDQAEGDVFVFRDLDGPAYKIFLNLVEADRNLYKCYQGLR
jgi:hypothetical protein